MMNRRQQERYQVGRAQRLTAEIERADDGIARLPCPLYSHDPTIQSAFRQGWYSVTIVDMGAHRLTLQANRASLSLSVAQVALNDIHNRLRHPS